MPTRIITPAEQDAERFAYGPAAPLDDATLSAALAGILAKQRANAPPGQKLMDLLGTAGQEVTAFGRRAARNLGQGVDAAAEYLGQFPERHAERQRQIETGAAATEKTLRGGDLSPQEQEALIGSPAAGAGTADLGAVGGVPTLFGTFAGKGAKTADLGKLAVAEMLERAGTAMEEIRQRTGWFKDPANDWKFEIPDNNLRLTDDGFEHPELEAAYPGLTRDVAVIREDAMPWEMGWFDTANPKTGVEQPTVGINKNMPDYEQRQVLGHELQHVVQQKENFSPGTSPWTPELQPFVDSMLEQAKLDAGDAVQRFEDALASWRQRQTTGWFGGTPSVNDFAQQNPDLANEYRNARQFLEAVNDPDLAPYVRSEFQMRAYENALGEVEARSVEDRLDWGPELRRATAPYATQETLPGGPFVLPKYQRQPVHDPMPTGGPTGGPKVPEPEFEPFDDAFRLKAPFP